MDQTWLLEAAARKRAADQESQVATEAVAEAAEQQFTAQQFDRVTEAMVQASKLLVRFLNAYQVTVKNFPEFPKTIGTPDSKEIVKAVKALETSLKPATHDDSAVVKALRSVETGLSKLAPSGTVKISNPTDTRGLEAIMGNVLAELQRLEMKPKITLPAPVVNVPEVDTASITKALTAVKKAVEDKPVPGVSVTPTDPLIRFTPMDLDEVSDNIRYYGYMDNRGGWYIRKYDKSGSTKTIRFAFGNSGYATAWTGRASLTYGYVGPS